MRPVQGPVVPPTNHPSRAAGLSRFKHARIVQISGGHHSNRIAIKFREGTGVRIRNGRWRVERRKANKSLHWNNAISTVQRIVDDLPKHVVVRAAAYTPAYEDELERRLEVLTGRDVPNMNLWYYLYVDDLTAEQTTQIVTDLNAQPIVDLAYPSLRTMTADGHMDPSRARWPSSFRVRLAERGAEPPVRSKITITQKIKGLGHFSPPPIPGAPAGVGDYELDQTYPGSMNVEMLRARYRRSRGWFAQFADVDMAWNTHHADFPKVWGAANADNLLLVNGEPAPKYKDKNGILHDIHDDHGTAVLGIVLSQDNGWGTTGLAPWLPMSTTIDNGTQTQVALASSVYLSTVYPQNDPLGSVGNALEVAAAHIMTGDLLGGGTRGRATDRGGHALRPRQR